jgi:hypothetical protein
MTSPNPTVDYGKFHADPTVIRYENVTIPVEAVTGWASKVTLFTQRNYAYGTRSTNKSSTVLFRVNGAGKSYIKLNPTHRSESFLGRKGHAEMEQLGGRLYDYGEKVIAPVLIPRLCQQVTDGGELRLSWSFAVGQQSLTGLFAVSQQGLTFSRETLAWADLQSTTINNGKVDVYQRNEKPGKQKPFATVDLDVTNSIVLPSVLETLRRFYTK